MKFPGASLRAWRYYFRSISRVLFGFEAAFRVISLLWKEAEGGQTLVKMKNGLSFWVRPGMDVWCLKETLLDRMYQKWGAELEPGWTVVDIGAGIGDFTVLASRCVIRGHVFAFEPHPSSYQLLKRNVELNGCSNVTLVNSGILGQRSRQGLLSSPSGEPLQASSLRGDPGSDSIPVACLSLEDALARYQIEWVDLLKIDCEGAEFPILLDSRDSVFDPVLRIVLEYHDFSGLDHRRLVARLEGLGYLVTRTANPVHEYLGFLYASRAPGRTRAEPNLAGPTSEGRA